MFIWQKLQSITTTKLKCHSRVHDRLGQGTSLLLQINFICHGKETGCSLMQVVAPKLACALTCTVDYLFWQEFLISIFSSLGHFSVQGLTRYLMSDDNFIIIHDRLSCYQDMTQPLSHYFINSSHNTYLTGNEKLL